MKRLTFLFPALTLMFLFSGCGQSGPLYIQGHPGTMAAPPAQQPASEDEPEEEQDSSDSSAAD